MTNPLDPYNWGDYPTAADLALDTCQERGCKAGNDLPYSTRCYTHATPAEQREIDVARADDRGVDEDWGDES